MILILLLGIIVSVLGTVIDPITYADPGCVQRNQTVQIVPTADLQISIGVYLLDILGLNLTIEYSSSYSLATWYCPPLVQNSNNQRLVVIVPGGLYTHLYNDWPMGDYSHVRALRQAGYQVVNIDRLGMGLSDLPPAGLLNIRVQAYVVHQLIGQIKTGAYSDISWGTIPYANLQKVFYIGHSLSSILGAYLTFWWPTDVAGFVLTGWAHTPTVGLVEVAPFLLTPACAEPQFANRPAGYITTAPGSRGFEFYTCTSADYNPAVVAYDEVTKGTATLFEFIDAFTGGWLIPLSSISIPLYHLIGQHDRPICPPNLFGNPDCCQPLSPFKAVLQRLLFPVCPDYTFEILPNAGHDLSLHLNHATYFSQVTAWLNAR